MAEHPGWGATGVYTCLVVAGDGVEYRDTLTITALSSFALVGVGVRAPHSARMSAQDLIDFGTELVELGQSMQNGDDDDVGG